MMKFRFPWAFMESLPEHKEVKLKLKLVYLSSVKESIALVLLYGRRQGGLCLQIEYFL